MLGKENVLSLFFFLRMKPDALDAFDGGVRQVTGPNATAGVFATYPKPFVTTANGFADQVTICSLKYQLFILQIDFKLIPSVFYKWIPCCRTHDIYIYRERDR